MTPAKLVISQIVEEALRAKIGSWMVSALVLSQKLALVSRAG